MAAKEIVSPLSVSEVKEMKNNAEVKINEVIREIQTATGAVVGLEYSGHSDGCFRGAELTITF